MKKIYLFLAVVTICMISQSIYAETDSVTCTFFMYPKAPVGCYTYVSYQGNAPNTATFTWNFDGGIIISGSGPGPYYIKWDTLGIKTVTLNVYYNGQSCNGSNTIHIVYAPQVFSVTGGGSYPYGGQGVHIGLSGSQLHCGYFLYLNDNTTSISSMNGTGNPLDFGLFTTTGTYTCKAKWDSTSGACLTKMNDSAVVIVTGYVQGQYICMVTYDTATQRNMVVWNKYPGQHIAHFNIYRQTYQENVFAKVGEVPFNSFSTYVDTIADPVVMAYKYELSASDSTGSESSKSPYHKTVHLEVSPGVTGFNLIWNAYEGFTFYTYKIHRKLGTGPWQLIDSIASDNISYTDPYITSGMAYYYIEVIRYSPCNPSLKAGIYESVVSNIGTSAPLGIAENRTSSILVYPNPARQTLNIIIPGTFHASSRLEIFSMDGQKYLEKELNQSKTVLDISSFASGLYILKVESDQSVVVKKIFKE
jgi:hypothetical protein